MIYIDNLSSFVTMCIDQEFSGLYFPQNREYVSTAEMARVIAKSFGKKLYFSFLLGLAVLLMRPAVSIAKKAFGTLVYKDTDDCGFEYCVFDNEESLGKSVD